ncbi:putative quinol monooxygenase [Limnohabitans sp.]|uniref:putative quinol monooxygenase n=1 Tax=Limnohabitans sp. TaxID=1907725 RepID=UPI00286EF294|nr:putative quinol monooxygenase [Limnohabitans sp.]
MSAINLLVLIEVQPGKRQQQIQAYEKLKPLVLAELGCLQYDMFADASDENKFVVVEHWASQDALDAHDQAPHMVEADRLNPSFRAKPSHVIKMNQVDSCEEGYMSGEDIDKVLADMPPRSLHRTLFNLANCYNQCADQSFGNISATSNADFAAPAIMCKSFAIELLLKFFIVADYPTAFSKAEIDAENVNLRGHFYSSLFDRISTAGQSDIAKKHSEQTGNAVSSTDFRAILISLGDDPFVGWRYIYETDEQKHLDVQLLSMTVSTLGLAAQDALEGLEE